jgi:hypothetical protein
VAHNNPIKKATWTNRVNLRFRMGFQQEKNDFVLEKKSFFFLCHHPFHPSKSFKHICLEDFNKKK